MTGNVLRLVWKRCSIFSSLRLPGQMEPYVRISWNIQRLTSGTGRLEDPEPNSHYHICTACFDMIDGHPQRRNALFRAVRASMTVLKLM